MSANEYEPWRASAQTEAEYFKAKYLAARQAVAELTKAMSGMCLRLEYTLDGAKAAIKKWGEE